MGMKFLLTSSGIKNDTIAKELSLLLGKPLSRSKLLFIPTAANTEGEDKRWLIGNLKDFEKYNFESIDILDVAAVPDHLWKKRIASKDVICVGGGNEKYLAEVFSNIGMKEFLLSLSDNQVYVGISAGSMVTGTFISEKAYSSIFPEENFENTKAPPMKIHDLCFIPHLNSDFFKHVRKETLRREKFDTIVYATDDETALSIENEVVRVVGQGESWVSVI